MSKKAKLPEQAFDNRIPKTGLPQQEEATQNSFRRCGQRVAENQLRVNTGREGQLGDSPKGEPTKNRCLAITFQNSDRDPAKCLPRGRCRECRGRNCTCRDCRCSICKQRSLTRRKRQVSEKSTIQEPQREESRCGGKADKAFQVLPQTVGQGKVQVKVNATTQPLGTKQKGNSAKPNLTKTPQTNKVKTSVKTSQPEIARPPTLAKAKSLNAKLKQEPRLQQESKWQLPYGYFTAAQRRKQYRHLYWELQNCEYADYSGYDYNGYNVYTGNTEQPDVARSGEAEHTAGWTPGQQFTRSYNWIPQMTASEMMDRRRHKVKQYHQYTDARWDY